MKNIQFCLSGLFFLLFCVSCEKRSIREEQESEQALIRVEGDMLVFKDLPTFSHAVKSITRYSANEYKMWLDNYPNFKSYKLNYNAALDAFDSITSQKDFELFKEKYKQIVKITPDTSIYTRNICIASDFLFCEYAGSIYDWKFVKYSH